MSKPGHKTVSLSDEQRIVNRALAGAIFNIDDVLELLPQTLTPRSR